ncbi:YcjF family protein [Photobacterium nomapromontoriensis]|uniref:YcjF family protein n=1 Tax=Photobacterium nomapromontoriensis TaxID=2910237 RepID=UPI003D0E0157
MSEQYKGKIEFDDASQAHGRSGDELELTSQLQFAEQETFLPESTDSQATEAEHELTDALAAKPKRRSGWLKGLLVGGAVMVAWQTVDYVVTAYQSGDWLALGWSVIVAGLATAGVSALGREFLSLRRLKQRQEVREQAQALLDADGIGGAKAFCTRLARKGNIQEEHAGYDRWQQSLAETHNDREVMQLYDQMVLGYQDKLARKLVAKYASEAAVMVAVSPLALADMLLVAWRNFRLIEQVSAVYGIELGYWSRIRLIKLVLANMAVAGASELIADSGMDMLSMDLAGRMSTRVAQGVGVGLLTGRLGFKAINLMRPLPWLPDQQPKLSEIRRDLLSQLSFKKEK